MFVFGGKDDHKTQVRDIKLSKSDKVQIQTSKINGCTLERIGELPIDFYNGACGTYKFSNEEERVMFCFPNNGRKKCFR